MPSYSSVISTLPIPLHIPSLCLSSFTFTVRTPPSLLYQYIFSSSFSSIAEDSEVSKVTSGGSLSTVIVFFFSYLVFYIDRFIKTIFVYCRYEHVVELCVFRNHKHILVRFIGTAKFCNIAVTVA